MAGLSYSPLRYPGGKNAIASYVKNLIELNNLKGGTYFELYAGGAAVALNLLFNNVVKKIVINDADYHIFAFWHSILNNSRDFLRLIDNTEVNIDEWHRQKEIYSNAMNESTLDVGFATFYLNRTNRSGIIHNAGPIGGKQQNGNYLIDVRFTKSELKKRIQKIADSASFIELHHLPTEEFLQSRTLCKSRLKKTFFYLDPPYYYKGAELYLNNYHHDEHYQLSQLLRLSGLRNWIVSYDNVIEIRRMYRGYRMSKFKLNYTLQDKREGSELVIFSDALELPRTITVNKTEQSYSFYNIR